MRVRSRGPAPAGRCVQASVGGWRACERRLPAFGAGPVAPPIRRGTEVVVTGAPRKRLVAKAARGFESHPLRQPSPILPISAEFRVVVEFGDRVDYNGMQLNRCRSTTRIASSETPRWPAVKPSSRALGSRCGPCWRALPRARRRPRSSRIFQRSPTTTCAPRSRSQRRPRRKISLLPVHRCGEAQARREPPSPLFDRVSSLFAFEDVESWKGALVSATTRKVRVKRAAR
jgi:hypothetical protein